MPTTPNAIPSSTLRKHAAVSHADAVLREAGLPTLTAVKTAMATFADQVWSDIRLPGDLRHALEAVYHTEVNPALRDLRLDTPADEQDQIFTVIGVYHDNVQPWSGEVIAPNHEVAALNAPEGIIVAAVIPGVIPTIY